MLTKFKYNSSYQRYASSKIRIVCDYYTDDLLKQQKTFRTNKKVNKYINYETFSIVFNELHLLEIHSLRIVLTYVLNCDIEENRKC